MFGVLAVLLMSDGTIMLYELSSVAAGMEQGGKSGDRIERESASSRSSGSFVCEEPVRISTSASLAGSRKES